MWIKFSIYSLITKFSSNNLDVPLEPKKWSTLGHIVGTDGVRVDPKKIEAMQDWHCPKTLKILRGFMGLMSYYCNFFKNFGKIATPLTTLLKENSFTWTLAATQAFQTLKMAMCTTPVLALLDFTKTFVLECDA